VNHRVLYVLKRPVHFASEMSVTCPFGHFGGKGRRGVRSCVGRREHADHEGDRSVTRTDRQTAEKDPSALGLSPGEDEIDENPRFRGR
jgi:hypothetical protein